MAGDTAAVVKFLPLFLVDRDDQPQPVQAREYIGRLTLRDFGMLAERFRNELAVTSFERQGLQNAYANGTATAPGWIRALEAAKDWGMPPWEITGDGQRDFWFRRYGIVKSIENKAKAKKK